MLFGPMLSSANFPNYGCMEAFPRTELLIHFAHALNMFVPMYFFYLWHYSSSTFNLQIAILRLASN